MSQRWQDDIPDVIVDAGFVPDGFVDLPMILAGAICTSLGQIAPTILLTFCVFGTVSSS